VLESEEGETTSAFLRRVTRREQYHIDRVHAAGKLFNASLTAGSPDRECSARGGI